MKRSSSKISSSSSSASSINNTEITPSRKKTRRSLQKSNDENEKTLKENKTQKITDTKTREEKLQKERKDHERTIRIAQEANQKEGKRGKIRCGKLPHRQALDRRWPKVDGFKNINVCSNGPGFWKELSPMKLGPITIEIDDKEYKITNLENLWQYSKVWNVEVDENNDPLPSFFKRRNKGWKDPKGRRRPKPSVKQDEQSNLRVMYSWWKGKQKLGYIEARKHIYCPLYAEHVVNTRAWRELQRLVEQGTNVQILGFDGYDVAGSNLTECFEDPSRPFGHELVLVGMLLGDDEKPWEQK